MTRRAPLVALALVALALVVGCGTTAAPGGGDSDLPAGRSGPYRLLDGREVVAGPCVVREDGKTLEDPAALPLDAHRVALYFTRVDGAQRTIRRVVVVDGRTLEGAPADVLTPTLAWQGDGVGAPDVAATRAGYAMVYDTAAGLGRATSGDGVTWQVEAAPLLAADPTTGEFTPLQSPTLVVRGDGTMTVAYESAGAIWGATGAATGGALVRLDGDDTTTHRDPLLAAGDDAVDAGSVGYASGSVGDPSLRVEETAVGRSLYRMFFSARSAPVSLDGGSSYQRAIGLAGSFDGVHFSRSAAAVLTNRIDPAVRAPSTWADGALRTWMFVVGSCDSAGRTTGIRVAVAPGNVRYDLTP